MSQVRASRLDQQTVFTVIFSVRLINAVINRTFFQPDEYYQALEPALNFVPGHHGAWITWEWTQRLRSAIHPALFSSVYYAADTLACLFKDRTVKNGILLYAPRTAQAVISALGEYYTWKLSHKVYDDSEPALVTLGLTLLNPWQWFCATRTFSNGLESTLTSAALFYWPLDWQVGEAAQRTGTIQSDRGKQTSTRQTNPTKPTHLRIALVLAATATILRPTNLLIWVVLALFVLFDSKQPSTERPSQSQPKLVPGSQNNNWTSRLLVLIREGVLCGSAVLALSALIDRAFYGTWTFPALSFLYFNVVQSLAVFYGNNDWHYYLSQGYPLLLTTTLPFAIIGLYWITSNSFPYTGLAISARKSLKQLATVCLVLPAALSVLSHKEVRFIYPILGPLHVIAALPVLTFFQPLLSQKKKSPHIEASISWPKRLTLGICLCLNLLIAGYTTLIHNSGLITTIDYLRDQFATHYMITSHEPHNMTVAVLMPCHSIPWRSHLLNAPSPSTPGIQAWALTCEPPLHLTSPEAKRDYLDEADVFYANPATWIRKNMSRRPPWTFSGLKNHERYHEPGLYTDNMGTQGRNKRLWTTVDSHQDTSTTGLDITDLLPYLQTAPGKPPTTETGVTIKRPWPHYLVFFRQLEPVMIQTLRGSGYVECWRVFNSHWHDDWRRTGDIVVWCLFADRAKGRQSPEVGRTLDRAEQGREGNDGSWGSVVPERSGKQTIIQPRA